ncbi:MAG: DUF3793 family protein [Ruminococcus sp.]|nr:DUF3793 family protein [Ruminococcus sp.]MBP3267050.1 DUF3793 family protein [Ruminococcus sp.]
MSELERNVFENELAAHTAPALMGVKCANLVSVSLSDETIYRCLDDFKTRTEQYGLKIRSLCKCKERTMIYVYHEKLLEAWLETAEGFLSGYGYTADMSLDEKLDILAGRMTCGNFPHEIGAFLGYPLEDIIGFIENQGRNCLLCGCWKVYSNAEEAQRTFNIYGRCREILCDRLKNGLDLYQAIESSKEEL